MPVEYSILKILEDYELIIKEFCDYGFLYRTAHDLIRINITAALKHKKKRHETIADALEQIHSSSLDNHIDELAYNYSQSNNKEKAAVYLNKAALNAENNYYPGKAITL